MRERERERERERKRERKREERREIKGGACVKQEFWGRTYRFLCASNVQCQFYCALVAK